MTVFTRRDFLKIAGLGSAAALVLAACGSDDSTAGTSQTSESSAASGTTETSAPAAEVVEAEEAVVDGCTAPEVSDITVLVASDMVTFFPINAANTLDGAMHKLMTDALVTFNPQGDLVWMLATGYEANDDATEYTFYLRQGIEFQDGSAWNAEAAKANFDVAINQDNGFKKNSNFKAIDNCEIVDEYTIKLNMKYSFGAMLNYLAHPSATMVSPKQLETGDYSAIETNMVGCGQYSLVEWRPGESWVLELNRDWWGYKNELNDGTSFVPHEAGFSTITFKPIAEAATRVAMLLSGEAQFGSASSTYIESLENGGLTVEYVEKGLSTTYLYLNCQKPIFSDKRVRQAIVKAIDLDTMIQVTEGGAASRSTSFISPAVSYYKANEVTEYNVEAAKALMAEAGYPDGFKAIMWSQNSTAAVARAEYIQQQLAAINVDIEIVQCESGVLSSGCSGFSGDPVDTEWDCYLRGWSSSTADADQGLGRFASGMWTPVGSNYCYYKNEEYDAACAEGGATADPDARAAAYATAQDIIWDDCPAVCLFDPKDAYAYDSSKTIGLTEYPDGGYFFREGIYVG